VANRRRGLIIVLLILAVMAVGLTVWRQPAVQDALLAREDLVALSNRVADRPDDWRAQYW
jgi:hypothetical protein